MVVDGTSARILSLPAMMPLERIDMNEELLAVRGDTLISLTAPAPSSPSARRQFVMRSLATGSARPLGFVSGRVARIEVDASGEGYLMAFPGGNEVHGSSLEAGSAGQHVVSVPTRHSPPSDSPTTGNASRSWMIRAGCTWLPFHAPACCVGSPGHHSSGNTT